jgi:hypothetical protein
LKFDLHKYWRHENARDVFISVNSVVFDDDGRNAILRGTWCTQAVECWFFTVQARFKITPEQYPKWRPYEPRGRVKL